MRSVKLSVALMLLIVPNARAFLGTEMAPLLQLVAGQVTEIERLTEQVGAAKDQLKALRELNRGVEKTVAQIQNLHALIERARELDPRSVRSLADLNELVRRAK